MDHSGQPGKAAYMETEGQSGKAACMETEGQSGKAACMETEGQPGKAANMKTEERPEISGELESRLRECFRQGPGKMTEKQEAILLAAVELFGEKGYAATSTKEIAVRAGVAEGTIFKHYETKKALMLALSEILARNVMKPLISTGLDEVFTGDYDSLEKFLQALIDNRLDLAVRAMPVLKVLIQEIPFQPEIRTIMLQNLPVREVAKQLDEMSGRGLFRELPGEELLKLFLTCFFGYLFAGSLLLPELFAENPERDKKNLVEFMARGLGRENGK